MAQRRRPNREPQAPPQNQDAEADVLGCMILAPKAIDTAREILQPDDFYLHRNQIVYQTILRLHDAGEPVSAIVLVDQLDRDGLLETAGGRVRIIELAANVTASGLVASHARIVKDAAQERAALRALQEATEAIKTRDGDVAQVIDLAKERLSRIERKTSQEQHTWTASHLNGPDPEPHDPPSLCGLFYDGEHHLLMAEPEAAKSMLMLRACLENARRGHASIYIDLFEMSEPDVRERLASLGADELERSRILYIRPQDPLQGVAVHYLRGLIEQHQASLICLDALHGLLRLHGLSEDKNDDVTDLWIRVYEGVLTDGLAVRPATITADHLTKNKETRGRWASGAHAKLDRWRIAYQLETLIPLNRSQDGLSRVIVSKDRPATLTRPSPGKVSLRHVGNHIEYELVAADAPSEVIGIEETWMRRITDALATEGRDMTQRQIIDAVRKTDGAAGSRDHKLAALKKLEELGYVRSTRVGQALYYALAREFKGYADEASGA